MASDGYSVGLAVDNRTSGAEIRIDAPTTSVQAEVMGGSFPVAIGVNGEGRLLCSFYAGIFHDAGSDNLVMPVSVTSGGKTASGTIRMYTAGGSHYPDYVITELNVGDLKIPVQLPVSGLDGFAAGTGQFTVVGTVTLVFSDMGGNAAASQPDSGVIDAVELAVVALAG